MSRVIELQRRVIMLEEALAGARQELLDEIGRSLRPEGFTLQPYSQEPEKRSKKDEAAEVLAFLNSKAKKAFRPVDANTQLIIARLAEGYTVEDMKIVIVRKCREWLADADCNQYLRPKTLFNKTNFSNYIGMCVEEA